MTSLPTDGWVRLRQQMPVTDRWAYFDNAAVAPLSRPALAALRKWSHEAATEGDTIWPSWIKQVDAARTLAASILGADEEEVAFVPNTTAGINLVAEGFPWRAGDNVVVPADEFPSNAYPWLNLASQGVETRRVSSPNVGVDLDLLFAACDARTRLISLSWVGYATGWRVNVAEVVERAHAHGILVFLDAIQGLGVFPLDVSQVEVDFLAADGHKWLLGPEGAGIFYLRREHLDRLRPVGVGWNSVVHFHDYSHVELTLRPTAARYEGGSMNLCGTLALGASLQLLADFGHARHESLIGDRVLAITDLACRRLAEHDCAVVSRREGDHRSGIVAFDVPNQDPAALRRRCLDAGVAVSARGGHLRISPHAYANEDDIERLLGVLVQ